MIALYHQDPKAFPLSAKVCVNMAYVILSMLGRARAALCVYFCCFEFYPHAMTQSSCDVSDVSDVMFSLYSYMCMTSHFFDIFFGAFHFAVIFHAEINGSHSMSL